MQGLLLHTAGHATPQSNNVPMAAFDQGGVAGLTATGYAWFGSNHRSGMAEWGPGRFVTTCTAPECAYQSPTISHAGQARYCRKATHGTTWSLWDSGKQVVGKYGSCVMPAGRQGQVQAAVRSPYVNNGKH